MVYIRLNPKVLSLLPKNLPSNIQIHKIQQQQYLKYQDLKYISKKYNLQLHKNILRSDIISEIDFNRLIELSKRTPEQKKFIEQLKTKHQVRMINNVSFKNHSTDGQNNKQMNSQIFYYGNNLTVQGNNNVKELTDSVSFGVTFIFSFFMAGLTGYYFAQYFFHLQLTGCLIVSIIFIFVTIFVQTWLYIIKQTKLNAKLKQQRKKRDSSSHLAESLKTSSLSFEKLKGKIKKE